MTVKRLLIVEDDAVTRDTLTEILRAEGYQITAASNGREAVELFMIDPFPVVITDVEMPVMDGNELISILKDFDMDPVIIVLTGHNELDIVIGIMKKGVFDYIIKPVDGRDMVMKLGRAFDVASLKRMKKIHEKEKLVKLENQISWLNWNEQIIKRDYDRIDRTLFKSLHTSFNQGGGFGSLVTLINIITQSAVKEGDNYLINSEIFDIITYNSVIAQKTIDFFSEINFILSTDFKTKVVSISEIYDSIKAIIDRQGDNKKVKGNNILFSDRKMNFDDKMVLIEPKYFEKTISELFMNAFKYSSKNSDITVIIDASDKNAEISVINVPEKLPGGIEGIPPEYENLIFEPFFRLVSNVYEDFDSLDYGLGLVIVDKVVTKLGGSVSASNIRDYSNIAASSVVKVDFTVSLPLQKKN